MRLSFEANTPYSLSALLAPAISAKADHPYLSDTALREAFRRKCSALMRICIKLARLPEFVLKAGVAL